MYFLICFEEVYKRIMSTSTPGLASMQRGMHLWTRQYPPKFAPLRTWIRRKRSTTGGNWRKHLVCLRCIAGPSVATGLRRSALRRQQMALRPRSTIHTSRFNMLFPLCKQLAYYLLQYFEPGGPARKMPPTTPDHLASPFHRTCQQQPQQQQQQL